MQDTVQFTKSGSPEAKIIQDIARRAASLSLRHGGDGDVLHHAMNVSACHASGNPLRLQDLLEADDFNFAHDVFGIDRHINRDTGKLENFFSPRFSAREFVQ